MRILILNGPNLNMTGIREPNVYGVESLEAIIKKASSKAKELCAEVFHIQSNYEGRLIDELQCAKAQYSGVIINPGALTHYSYALRDAIACCGLPVVEVHLSDIEKREPFRSVDVVKDVCIMRIMGKGGEGYISAVEELILYINNSI